MLIVQVHYMNGTYSEYVAKKVMVRWTTTLITREDGGLFSIPHESAVNVQIIAVKE